MNPTVGAVALGAAVALAAVFFLVRRRQRGRRRRVEDVERRYDKALQKFHVELDRFKFARQGAVKVLLNHDHAIWTEVEELAREGEESRESMRSRVHRYVEEIVPFFRPLAYYSFGITFARWLLNRLYRVDYDPTEVERIKSYSRERPRAMIYLMNHRSNADYVIAAYVLAEKLALSFAVGEWARVWPLEFLFKSFGSYFLRRGYPDRLYHTVLRRYVQLVTKNGVTQALFPEGGLSRDGLFRPPKIGLIDSIICSKEDRSFRRELVFVPVAINYDRVLEDRALVAENESKRPPLSRWVMATRVFEIMFGNVQKLYRHEMRKNGIASVRFGDPVSFDEWHQQQGVDIFSLSKLERRQHVARFSELMLGKIAERMPATPLCVVARVLVEHQSLTRQKLVEE
ncbi:MAG: 1-acyl-sn-glycerol-3-phosphate acyltransferase, partial [Myxococcota bacterium]